MSSTQNTESATPEEYNILVDIKQSHEIGTRYDEIHADRIDFTSMIANGKVDTEKFKQALSNDFEKLMVSYTHYRDVRDHDQVDALYSQLNELNALVVDKTTGQQIDWDALANNYEEAERKYIAVEKLKIQLAIEDGIYHAIDNPSCHLPIKDEFNPITPELAAKVAGYLSGELSCGDAGGEVKSQLQNKTEPRVEPDKQIPR